MVNKLTHPHKRDGRAGLVRARMRRGLSQEAAAEQIGVSPTTWARWERGEQGVRPVYRTRIAAAWQVGAEEVERWLDTQASCDDLAPWEEENGFDSVASSVEAAERLWRWEMDAQRRRMLAALPFVPAALGEWLLAWQFDTAPPPAVPTSPSPGSGARTSVGLADVQRVLDAHQAFTQMDHRFGAGLVRPAVTEFMSTTLTPLLRGAYTEEVGSRLLSAAAQMTELAGWMAFDLGRQGQAQQHYGQALRLAKAAEDDLIGARILASLAHQAADLHQSRWAVRLASAAVEAGQRAQASPRVLAMLLIKHARALSVRLADTDTQDPHTARQITRILHSADDAFGKGLDDRDPKWIAYFDEAELAGNAGSCWRKIGDFSRATSQAERAMRSFGNPYSRSVQLTRLSAADSYLGMGDLDQAVDTARQAISGLKELTSTRAGNRALGFAKRLKADFPGSQANEFGDYVRSELAG
ncbi:helix-turn-helix domain-containing protein [Sinosporangium siamense]|uniref:HTH cro/C1-type domain-containing protein n=1 Tax=Sinosporangium siamense TaxID=1367973 RepID=A0A919RMN1_9ACTN|nr:helix-turn-helix domain-containing protein [Sinosporangium siamense]GII96368.1 hypothetical protein Ssi02_65990 [Sinosporangium siamense]